MNRLAPWLLAAVALAGCSKNTARPSAKMSGPQGVAVYRGYGADQAGVLRPLVAVANTLGNDLRVIDAVNDKVLAGPTQVAALAVVTEPRPSLIAAGPLHDLAADRTALARADLLVVAPRGQVARHLPAPAGSFGAVLQSIVTWDDLTRVDVTVDLGDLIPDSTLTSLLVVPVWDDSSGVLEVAAGAALVLASTSDGALVSILATRDAATEAIHLAAPAVQLLGFTALDLAVTADGTRVYAATLDPVPGAGGVLGVAELDNTVNVVSRVGGALTLPAVSMPVRALSARAGTTQVAAIDVAPFLAADPSSPQLDTFGPAVPRVYAALDPAACGRDRALPCGIAVIDPALGTLAADPAGELPFQLPIQIPGAVVDIAVAGPPARTDLAGFLKLDPGPGWRWTSAVAAVSSTAGRIYLADLSRFGPGNGSLALTVGGGTRVVNSLESLAAADSASIGIWSRPLTGSPVLKFDLLAAPGIRVTPGYTGTELFSLTYQGVLPGLLARAAVARVVSGAPSWIAVQEATLLTAPGTSPWRGVARLYDPRLGLRLGDLVVVQGLAGPACPTPTFELVITAFLPPDPVSHPGGAVAVEPSLVQPDLADPTCLPPGDYTPVTVSFRAPGLVLTGSVSGHVGRPEIVLDAPETAAPFEFRYADEATLPCPIMPDDPQDWPPAPADVAACEADAAACRATCDQLVLARRARRSFYVTETCQPTSTATGQACQDLWVTTDGLQLPMPKGPALAFKVGITAPATGKILRRDTALHFNTSSGLAPAFRTPAVGVTGTGYSTPYGVIMFDRSAATGAATDAIHGFAAFEDAAVLDFAPWSGQATAVTIR